MKTIKVNGNVVTTSVVKWYVNLAKECGLMEKGEVYHGIDLNNAEEVENLVFWENDALESEIFEGFEYELREGVNIIYNEEVEKYQVVNTVLNGVLYQDTYLIKALMKGLR